MAVLAISLVAFATPPSEGESSQAGDISVVKQTDVGIASTCDTVLVKSGRDDGYAWLLRPSENAGVAGQTTVEHRFAGAEHVNAILQYTRASKGAPGKATAQSFGEVGYYVHYSGDRITIRAELSWEVRGELVARASGGTFPILEQGSALGFSSTSLKALWRRDGGGANVSGVIGGDSVEATSPAWGVPGYTSATFSDSGIFEWQLDIRDGESYKYLVRNVVRSEGSTDTAGVPGMGETSFDDEDRDPEWWTAAKWLRLTILTDGYCWV